MRPTPFIGVCGVDNPADYQEMMYAGTQIMHGTGRFLMLGVIDNFDCILPDTTDLTQAFAHCTYQNFVQFKQDLFTLPLRANQNLRGIQLNCLPFMTRDFSQIFRQFKNLHPNLVLMLQAHSKIIPKFSPDEVVANIKKLQIDYFFLDVSQSRGIKLSPVLFEPYIAEVYKNCPSIAVAMAGGLCAENLEFLCKDLLKKYPDISIDARGQLSCKKTLKLNLQLAKNYLKAWQKLESNLQKQTVDLGMQFVGSGVVN